jgi:hypothetical protein
MELKLQSKDLLQKIKVAARVINSKNALPILGDFLFETKGDLVFITASDSEQWLSLKCPVVSCDGDTRFCVSASDFLKAVDNLNDVVITLSLDEQSHTIKCDYGNGSFTMPYEDANEFPMANMDSTDAKEFIIGTENSIVQHLQFACPEKRFYPLSKDCICHNMRLTTLGDVYDCVCGRGGKEIVMDDKLIADARHCIDEMLAYGG